MHPDRNITIHPFRITAVDRARQNGHTGLVCWLTGLSGAGKSTVADLTSRHLYSQGIHHYLLDGDNVRTGLSSDLGFSADDRTENVRRIAEVAKMMADAGLVVLVSLISPFRTDRERAKEIIGPHQFLEIYLECPLDICIQRDPKGLYQKALTGQIQQFTGIDSPYEPPESPALILHSSQQTSDENATLLAECITRQIQVGAV
jgi:adenylylsulfate kinase